MIHPTAIIHPKAHVDPTVDIGPHSIIDEHVTVGAGCVIAPNVYLTGNTKIGVNNRFHAGCVIGDAPQDLKYANAPTRLNIGDNNTFREGVTVHRSNKMEEDTVIGSNNFFMANSHVGHNTVVGNHVILANGALLAGHVTVADRVFISGNCSVHQFVRIGTLALMQGGTRISKDLPPFTIAMEANLICGLNTIGLRRAGYTATQRLELKRLYHDLFRSQQKFADKIAAARAAYTSEPAQQMIQFAADTQRGLCSDISGTRNREEPLSTHNS